MTEHIMIIRHAEKPSAADGICGVDADGHASEGGLSVRGWQRAGALVAYFSARGTHALHIATPVVIFAAASHAKSQRPVLTVQPLAESLGVPLLFHYRSGADEAQVLTHALHTSGPVLICWRHESISMFAHLLGHPEVGEWGQGCFDAVWVFRREGEQWRWTITPQALLAGDERSPRSTA